MPRLLTLALVAAAAITPLPAHAIPIDVKFMGTVQSQIDSGFAVNSPVSGEFIYDTATAKYTLFTIGDRSVAPGFASSADVTPDLLSAIYQAQLSPVQQGGTLNSTFTVDLEALIKWPSNDAVALLTNPERAGSEPGQEPQQLRLLHGQCRWHRRPLAHRVAELDPGACPSRPAWRCLWPDSRRWAWAHARDGQSDC